MTEEIKGKTYISHGENKSAIETTVNEVNLMELLYRFYEKAIYIVLAVAAGAIIAGIYSYWFATPRYESTAKLYVLNSDNSILDLSDLQIGSYLTADYKEVFKAWEVNEQVLENLGLNYSYSELAKMVTITNPTDTRILYITVTSDDADQSMLMANEYAEVARQYISDTMLTKTPSILSTALISTKPVSPNKMLNMIIGAIAGAVISLGVILILFLGDDKIKSEEDILNCCGIHTLAIVPHIDEEEVLKKSKKNRRKTKAEAKQ
jgi:capsular polysaccharide biosynthesis protein